ncbi:MAG: phosphate ABC transporter substrate-binding protein PstS [Bacteroidales bacterium]|jgi:phosphate transport system substrate-binding protein
MKTIKLVYILTVMAFVGVLSSGFLPILKSATKSPASDVELLGAGASFPYPLYSKMFSEYNIKTGVKINYQSIGSGGGIKQLMSKTVDFGASDAFLNDEDIAKMPAAVVHIPTCLGADVITYNIPGDPTLKFTPDVVVDIFLGKIINWNDARIKQLNPSAKIPDMPISIVHRSDGSGTTFIFTDYLSKISEEWKNKVGHKTSVDWPIGIGAKGNEGVSGMIKQTPGALGYVELIYALQNKMPVGLLQNKSGKYVEASIKSVTTAANIAIPADARVSITNTDAPDGYPISSFTWILLYKEQNYDSRAEAKAKEVVKLVWWMTHDAQQFAAPLIYAPLPKEALKVVEANLKSIVFNGKSLL